MELSNREKAPRLLFEGISTRLGYSAVDVDEKRFVLGSALVACSFLTTREQIDHFFFSLLLPLVEASQHEKPMLALNGLRFVKSWLQSGRRQQHDWYTRLRNLLIRLVPSPVRRDCMDAVDMELCWIPRVVGKWSAKVGPLIWTTWDSLYVAKGLTALCGCFCDVRPHEFFEEGDALCSLQQLRSASSSLSCHVVLSSLTAFQESKERGCQVLIQWLEIAENLRTLQNYHMLLAVHNGWHLHQLDRLHLWDDLPSAILKRKDCIDVLCSVETRFAGLLEEQNNVRRGACGGMIPCMFWFVQKAELLGETPRISTNGTINPSYMIAAYGVFASLKEIQNMSYKNLAENEATYYFSQLAGSKSLKEKEVSYEMLYKLSDDVKSSMLSLKPKRSSLTSFFKRSSSRESSIDTSGD
jgi:hypothetical protein